MRQWVVFVAGRVKKDDCADNGSTLSASGNDSSATYFLKLDLLPKDSFRMKDNPCFMGLSRWNLRTL